MNIVKLLIRRIVYLKYIPYQSIDSSQKKKKISASIFIWVINAKQKQKRYLVQ